MARRRRRVGGRPARPEAVDEDTLFGIASNTKAFTAAALAILVDEGRIDWDDRVIDHLPQFRLWDPWVTREFTIRDLLTHRSGLGLGAGDLMMWPETDFTRQEIFAGLQYLEPTTSFRSAYAYDNNLYIVAGEIIPAVTGQSWQEFVAARILEPLDMAPCAVMLSKIQGSDNLAAAHVPVDGEMRIVPSSDIETAAAAGSIWCNVTGIAKWMRLQLRGGLLESGAPLFSAERQREMWSPQTIRPVSEEAYEMSRTHFSAYGLGWGLDDFDGYKRVSHGGGLPGMVTYTNLLPELNLGVIVLTNQENVAAMQAITFQILKAYTGVERRDWVTVFADLRAEREAEAEAAVAEARASVESEAEAEAAATGPILPLAAYAGTYADPWRGAVTVSLEDGGLILEFSRTDRLRGAMEPFRYNTFIVRWDDRTLKADAYVRFGLGFDGTVETMSMQAVSPLTDFSYDFHDLHLTREEEP